mmetsp:Transcript_26550/g.65975  ORF Transcript_26550/g.65975 Transcript_26550/m.65975 type:complete len:210 (-) Transcript_26550:674-1303(-)
MVWYVRLDTQYGPVGFHLLEVAVHLGIRRLYHLQVTLFCSESLVGFLLQQLDDEVLGVIRDLLPSRTLHVKLANCHFFEDGKIVVALERGTTREQRVHDDASRPHVTPLVIMTCEHLGGQVAWRPDGHGGFLVWGVGACGTEIDHLDGRIGRIRSKQNVFRFDVSVHDVVFVAVVESRKQLKHDLARLQLTQVLTILQLLKQITSRVQL